MASDGLTMDAINHVVNVTRDAIKGFRWRREPKKYCAIVTLDIRRTFNSARWNCIKEVLRKLDAPFYLEKMVADYLSHRILKYDTEIDPKEYEITGDVLQGSVLGLLLWNV
ncbi:reverse [Lasius niger]|uniref:Reverse n=1 Tax=Lasius niger TaxID=67767 RepID=A0A0J7L0A5_LASNI|nr:reverse [Lasius niger]